MAEIEEMEEDNSFPQDDIERVTAEVAEEVLKEVMWDETQVPQWINTICEMTTKQLVALNRPYKFVVTCVMQ